MRSALYAVLLCLAGCRSPELVSAAGDLRADRERVGFGDVWLNFTAQTPLQITNTGRTSLTLTLVTTGPFVAPASVQLARGESRAVELSFAPTALGAAAGILTVTTAGAQLRLALEGNGVEPPSCAATACSDASLDEKTLLCVLSPRADGAACKDNCIEGACSKGACLGTAKSCDDGDPCTTDGCSPDVGCVHSPRVCQASSACTAGSCSAALGCVESPVADGIACGAADCVSAMVCINRQCVSRAVPEGAACGAQTVCQQAGRCESQQCVQAAPAPIPNLWTYAPPSGRTLHGLVADGLGNYFVAECRVSGVGTNQCELLSFAANGAERWRTAFPHQTRTTVGPLQDSLMLAGTRVISTIDPDWVYAIDAESGALSWSLLFHPPSGPSGAPEESHFFSAVGFDGVDQVLVSVATTSKYVDSTYRTSQLFGLVASTGAWQHHLSASNGHAVTVVVDRTSSLFVDYAGWSQTSYSVQDPTNLDLLTALTPHLLPIRQWSVKWQQVAPFGGGQLRQLRATHKGRLLTTHPGLTQIIPTVPGPTLFSAPSPSQGDVSALWSDKSLFLYPKTCAAPPCSQLQLVVVDNQTLVATPVALPQLSWLSEGWLTHRNASLVALKPTGAMAQLREIESSGDVLMQCSLALELDRRPRSVPILSAGRYAMLTGIGAGGTQPRLDVWELPGYSPAVSGWVSPRGGPGLDLRAR
jgi:hypothetical protein